MEPKIFCIGFNKTGTTSLDKLFRLWGMKSFHGEYHDASFDDDLFKEYQCFSDGEYHDFKGLDETFSGSKFILNTRKLDDWLVSRIKHVEYRLSHNLSIGWMAKEYKKDPKAALQNWISRRIKYYQDVLSYFENRGESLLIVNVCDCTNQRELVSSIASFLSMDDAGIETLPRENLATQRTGPGLRRRIKNFFSTSYKARNTKVIRGEVHEALRLSGLPESEWSSDGFGLT